MCAGLTCREGGGRNRKGVCVSREERRNRGRETGMPCVTGGEKVHRKGK